MGFAVNDSVAPHHMPAAASAAPAATPRAPGDRRRWRSMHVIVACGFALLGVLWLSVGWVVTERRGEAIRAEFRQNANVARVLQEQTERVIATVDQATLRVAEAVAESPDETPDLVRFANETGLAPKILVQLSQVWADGRFAASNLDPKGEKTGHVDLSQREHVRIHLAPQTLPEPDRVLPANGLFIGKPVLGKVSQRWTIQLSRRIVARDGRVLGVVVASLDPAYFEEVYARVQLGRSGGVALVASTAACAHAWSAARPKAWAPCSARTACRRAATSASRAARRSSAASTASSASTPSVASRAIR